MTEDLHESNLRPAGAARNDPTGRDDDDALDRGDGEAPGRADEAAAIAESAAEIGVGAIIAPFTGGQTVEMVESLVSIVEAGVDHLTHLGDHHPADAATPASDAKVKPAAELSEPAESHAPRETP
ncbi:MAG: hypothetical protein ACYDAK_03550 [Candidatus Limnocylindrales bacterium]